MNKFTPGPWEIARNWPRSDRDGEGIICQKGMGERLLEWNPKDNFIGIAILCPKETLEEELANVNLISAAPDLLEACQLLLKCDTLESIGTAKRAIAKAKGEL